METFKTEIYNQLKTLNASVSQASNNVFNTLPAVTYFISNNAPTYDFEKTINLQDVEVTIDIYAETSTVASSLLVSAEAEMRSIDLFLNFTTDVPDTDGLYHINARFSGLI